MRHRRPRPRPLGGKCNLQSILSLLRKDLRTQTTSMDGMEAANEPLHNAADTEQLLELIRQRFLDFLQRYTIHDGEDSRSQLTHASEQSAPLPPQRPYVEQVPTPCFNRNRTCVSKDTLQHCDG